MAGQWLRLCPSIEGGVGFSLGQGTKIPHAAQCSQKIKQTNKRQLYKQTTWVSLQPYHLLAFPTFLG